MSHKLIPMRTCKIRHIYLRNILCHHRLICFRLAALWAQYTSQEMMAQVASKHNIELTFFHGKGGTVGRGGNPALYRAILSHPPNTINGRFRVTEQGGKILKSCIRNYFIQAQDS